MNKIDILIPVIDKDLEVLPHVIDSARKNVRHPIGEIFIVAPVNKKIKNLSDKKNCIFVDENSILPITKKDIKYSPTKRGVKADRSGWLFQQFLKLGGDTLGSGDGFLVIDADTVLIRPHVFERNGKSVFFYRSLYYKPYFETYSKLLGEKAPGPNASIFFVSHYMYFDKKKLGELKKRIEVKHGTSWYTAIMNCMNKNRWDSFSEYETYGNFLFKNYPDQIILKKRRNLGLKRARIKEYARMNLAELAKYYRSISFHSWNN